MEHLSERQSAILRFMRDRIIETGDPPTLRETAGAVGLASRSSVHYQLRLLEEQGLVTRTGSRSRGYRPT